MNATHLPFKDLKVLELSSVLAGPLAGSFFAEGGAEVVKVEHPVHGDVTRSWRARGESSESEVSAYYAAANTHKKVVRIDLGSEHGQLWLENQLASSDVLLQNFKEKDLTKFNLTPSEVASRHPHLVHIRLIGFTDQPERLAYDVVVQAEIGFMHMNGSADGPPTRLPIALMDVLASDQIRSAALSGLYARERGTRGWYSEVSLERSGISALVNRGTNYLMNSTVPHRLGSAHPNIAPYGDIIEVADAMIVLAVGSDVQFRNLCKVLGQLPLSEDDRYKTNSARVNNRAELIPLLQQAAQSMKSEKLMADLLEKGVPAGVIRSLDEVFRPGSDAANTVIEENVDGAGRAVRKTSTVAYRTTVFGK
jgi:crotonobetainyl-CoA:carnitine CoA-transferase CaiB-like acyl-CoA transferase